MLAVSSRDPHLLPQATKTVFTLITMRLRQVFTALMTPNLQRVDSTLNLEQRASALCSLIRQAMTMTIANDERVLLYGAAASSENFKPLDIPSHIGGSWLHRIREVIDRDDDQEPCSGDEVALYWPSDSRRAVPN